MPNDSSSDGVDRSTISSTDAAYHKIKAEILTNRLAPGDALPIERFCNELDCSRTPLREATQRLEKEGFVEVKARMGTFVAHLNLRQISEMYEVRQALEGLAARRAARRGDADQLAVIKERLISQSLEDDIDYASLSDAGTAVHRYIVEHCGSKVLKEMLKSLQDHFTRFRNLSLRLPEKVLSSHREHIAIVNALEAGDGERAQTLIEDHLSHAAESLLHGLLQSHDADGPALNVVYDANH